MVDSLYYRPRGSFLDRTAYATAVDAGSARRARENELRSYYTSYSADRARLDSEYRARQAASDALYYRPYSPRYGYLSSY